MLKRTLFIAGTVTVLLSFKNAKTVYLCNSEKITRYHLDKQCRGLNACKHQVISVLEENAINNGLKLCGWED